MAMQPPPPPAAPYAPQYAAPPPSASGYAGFWIRFLAYIIDAIIVGAITFGLIKATGVITVLCPAGVTDPNDPSCSGAQISAGFYVILLIPILYDILLWSFGGTLGPISA